MPRDCGGASSETYTGAVTELKPTAMPSIVRPMRTTATFGASIASTDPARKSAPPANSVGRRPKPSAQAPPVSAPAMAPMSTTLTTHDSACVERWNDVRRNTIAAAITPMS